MDIPIKAGTARSAASIREEWIERGLLIAAGVSAAAILLMLLLFTYFSLPLFTSGGLAQILSWQWKPFEGEFGILPMCLGSLFLAGFSMVLAVPTAVGICGFTTVIGPRGPARVVLAFIHFMTGIPTVIYGFVSVILLVPLMREWFHEGTGFCLLTAGLCLSLLVLPTIVLVFHTHLEQMDPAIRLAAEGMGLTPVQQFRHVLLPTASRGIIAATALGFGRAAGDAVISLMLAGNAAQTPDSLFDSIRTLTAHIALVVATDSQSMSYRSVFASGLILFAVMGIFNTFMRRLTRRGKERRHEKDS
jgi:phosphate transport system permease protein